MVKGKVVGVNPEKGTVTILAARPSACAHGCDNCASCDKAVTQLTVTSRQSCNIGDIVEAEVSNKAPLGALAAVYLFPVIMLFIIAVLVSLADSLWIIAAIIILGLLLTCVVLRIINKAFKDRVQGEIINLKKI